MKVTIEFDADEETVQKVLALLSGKPATIPPLEGRPKRRKAGHPYRGDKGLVDVIFGIVNDRGGEARLSEIKRDVRKLKAWKTTSISAAIHILKRSGKLAKANGVYTIQH